MPDIVQSVKQKLGIKYVDAKALVAEAREICGIEGDEVPTERHEEVMEEACEMFKDYPEEKQNSMKQQAATEAPEWKKKAMAACQKLEQEYESRQAVAAATETVQQRLRDEGVPEDQIDSTKVTTVRKLEEGPPDAQGKGKLTVRTHTCACVIQ